RERCIDAHLLRGLPGRRTELRGEVDTSPLEARLHEATGVEIEAGKRGGHPQGDVEVTVVDRFDFDREGIAFRHAFSAAESRHAANHRTLIRHSIGKFPCSVNVLRWGGPGDSRRRARLATTAISSAGATGLGR